MPILVIQRRTKWSLSRTAWQCKLAGWKESSVSGSVPLYERGCPKLVQLAEDWGFLSVKCIKSSGSTNHLLSKRRTRFSVIQRRNVMTTKNPGMLTYLSWIFRYAQDDKTWCKANPPPLRGPPPLSRRKSTSQSFPLDKGDTALAEEIWRLKKPTFIQDRFFLYFQD